MKNMFTKSSSFTVAPRRVGKSFAMLKFCCENDVKIACSTEERKQELSQLAKRLELTKPKIQVISK